MNNINMNKLLALFTVLATFLGTSYGKTIYVNANFPTAGNGTSWSSPYTNLQDAVTASVAGDLVLVTNGVYAPITTGNKAITIQSVNGYADTIIDAKQLSRCAMLGTGVNISGFTFANGYDVNATLYHGGGINATATSTVSDSLITNCLLTVALSNFGGGMYGGILLNSTVVGNRSVHGGGLFNVVASNVTVVANTGSSSGGVRGGTLYSCNIQSNTATAGTGGMYETVAYDSVIHGNFGTSAGGTYGGTIIRCVVYNNTATVYYGGGTHGTTVIDCTISGNTSKTTGGGSYGGSLYNSIISNNLATTYGGGTYNSALVSNCVVVGNIARSGANSAVGGGVYGGVVMDSLISGNIATNPIAHGGGVALATIYRCRVEKNVAHVGGGVFGSETYDSVIVSNTGNYSSGGFFTRTVNQPMFNTTIEFNTAIGAYAGGGWGNYLLSNCVIRSNSAPAVGGVQTATLRNCVVSNNVATVTDGGGVLNCTVYDSLIENNSAKNNGGGTYGGTLTGCTISGNMATNGVGGGTYVATLTGCTIYGNMAFDGGGAFGTVLYDSLIVSNVATRNGGALTRGKYYNCTIYGNTAQDYAVGYANGHTTEPSLYNCVVYGNVNTGANARHLQIPASGVFAFSSIDGANRFYATLTPAQFVQSIYGDPLFTDPANSDFTLLPTSPCINKGANQYVTTSTDFVGRPRIKDWRVDMGAYENQSQRLAVTPNPLHPMGRAQIDVTLDDYVQDGLIQHFDGHVLDPAVKIWPQLVEGQPNHFAPYYDNASMYNAYTLVPGVGMVFDTNGTYRSRPVFSTGSFAFFGSNGPPGTVEMCVTQKSNPPNTSAAMSGMSGGRGLTMMSVHATTPSSGIYAGVSPWFAGQPKISRPPAFETNMLITTAAIIDKGLLASVFVNGVEKTVSNYGSVISGTYPSWTVYIGGDNAFTIRGFVGTVHAIRIYDRKLEPWEVEKNRKLDERRF